MPDENRITKVELVADEQGHWTVYVTKHFAPEYGGGEQIFREPCGWSVHRALDVARGMVTLSPGQRTDLAQ
jgi:hypothetical protein